jgi:hypothetical protein
MPIVRRTPLARPQPAEPKPVEFACEDCGVKRTVYRATRVPKCCLGCTRRREKARATKRELANGVDRIAGFIARKKRQKPIPHRNQERRPASLAIAQRDLVMERANGRCQFEYVSAILEFKGEKHPMTTPCGSTEKIQTVHIVRRHKIAAPVGDAPPAVYSVDVVIAGCKRCHDRYDGRTQSGPKPVILEEYREACFLTIRVAELARLTIKEMCVPVDLSEILPAGAYAVDNQFEILGAYAPGVAA